MVRTDGHLKALAEADETAQERLARMRVSPMQKMILETLAARHRLGHIEWSIERNPTTMRMLCDLQRKGFVGWRHYTTPNAVRAWLTDDAKEYMMEADYVPPILGGPQ